MAAVRLTDGQKEELVARFREGAGLQELAEAYGCSPNTVSRTARALLGQGVYERLKGERAGRRSAAGPGGAEGVSVAAAPLTSVTAEETAAPVVHAPESPGASGSRAGRSRRRGREDQPKVAPEPADPEAASAGQPGADAEAEPDAESLDPAESPAVLAIDDADDFGDDDQDLLDDDPLSGDDGPEEPLTFRPQGSLGETRPLPFAEASLPAAAWMLVDEKTVALQPRLLRDFPELGSLPAEEQERQALSLFLSQRQAKRLCGRSQRVIPIPDPAVFVITAPYLLQQDITRVVIEGALYALPGS